VRTQGFVKPRFGDSDLRGRRTNYVAGAAALFVPFAVIGFLLCWLLEIKGWIRVPIVIVFGSAAATAIIRFAIGFANTAGDIVARFVAPSGSTTPYEKTFSYQQSLAVRGDIAGALASYEAELRQCPHDIEAYVQAAELYASSGNAARAIDLFRALREVPGVSRARDVYASNRLVDLYLGAGSDDGRALVELRRLIECHPGTDTAARAREALGSLKAQRSG
jgi:hypothetical protein